MKRQISFLLSLVMIFSVVVVDPTYTAASSIIRLTHLVGKRLVETKEGIMLQDVEKDSEEATLQWDISYNGHYELTYYTDSIRDNLNDTSKVVLGFDVGKDKDDQDVANKVKVQGKIYKSDGSLLNIKHYQYVFPYTGSPVITDGEAFTSDLSFSANGETVAESTNELSVKLGSNLSLRLKIEGTTLRVWTNEVRKGYFTDFTLTFGEKDSAYPETSSVMVFPGISKTNISSTHLTEEKMKDDNSLASKDKVNAPGEKSGERPGIKVEMERPKIRKGTRFEYISGSEGESLKVTLNLETKLEQNDALSSNQVQVNFDLSGDMTQSKSNAALTGNIVSGTSKYVSFEKEMMSLYFSKEDTYVQAAYADRVIKWPALEESMVIGGELTLSGLVNVDSTIYQVSTGNVALSTGYTYLQYIPEQSNVGETTLQITPFKYKGEIIYEVYSISGDQDTINEDKSLFGTYKFTYDPNYPNRKLELSIPSAVPSTFMIKAILSSENNNATSQKVYYDTDDEGIIIKPYTPQIRQVSNIYVIPEDKVQSNVEASGFTITWNAPEEEKLKLTIGEKGKLYFELALYNSVKDNKAVVAVFEATLKDGKVQIKALDSQYEGVIKYDSENNQFIATKVVLKDMEENHWRKVLLPLGYENEAVYPYNAEDKQITSSDYDTDLNYTIPNSFYLTMRTILESGVKGSTLKTSANESEVYPLTLDKTVELVPAPTTFNKTAAQDTTDVTIFFNNVTTSRFRDYILEPAKWILKNSGSDDALAGTYEITLYQDTYVDSTGKKQTNDINESKMTTYIEQINEDIEKNNASGSNKVYVITEALNEDSSTINLTEQSEVLEALRQGRIVKFDYKAENMDGKGNIPVQIQGLDSNESYYIRVRVKLESERTKGGKAETRVDYSLFSKVFGFTTSTVSKPINPDEEVPATPKDFKAEAKDSSTAILNWQDPDISTTGEAKISYEIIRTTEEKLSEEVLKKRDLSTGEILAKEADKKAVLLTGYKQITDNNKTYYELTDDTLQPNTLYYYYIRVVYNGLHSEWIYQPVTTKNIDKPISLKAYNAQKTTVDISFLAKAPYDLVPGTYDFGIMIQGEENSDWEEVPAKNLKRLDSASKETTEDGYNYFEYRISGLKPGKRYNIKVCLIDKTKDKIDGQYQHSLYSEAVYIRTEYDEDAQQQEDKYKEFLEKFDSEIEKLRRKAYWTIEKDTAYKYRADYINSDMALDKSYELVSSKDSDEAIYYFPASVMTKMNEYGVTLKINLGSEIVSVRPQTFLEDQKQIKEAIEKIADNELEDYYLMLSVEVNESSAVINGETAVSPQIILDAQVVYMKQEDILTEADIMEALESIIKSERTSFISKLETKVTNGTIADDVLQGLIDASTHNIETKHIKKVNKIMNDEIKKTYEITTIAKSILIVHQTDNILVNGYYYANGWIKKDSFITAGGAAIEANLLGRYIFTGQRSLIQTLPSLAPYQSMISQYGLDEFFVLNSYMINTAATKQQVYGALARVMGASPGTDYITYLNNKGIKGISRLGLTNAIRQDETIYVMMQGYEILKRRSVSSVVITNRQSVQNIGAFQPVYRQYVYTAVQLKVITPVNAKVIPSKQMTVQEIIEMLYKVIN